MLLDIKIDKNKIKESIILIEYAILVIMAYIVGVALMIAFCWAWIPIMIIFYPAYQISSFASKSQEMTSE